MQVLTPAGSLEQIHQRSYPLGGIDVQQMRSPGAQAIPLTRLPTGEMRMLALSRVYRTNPLVYACVHLLARGLSSIPVRTYTADGAGARRRVRSDLPPAGPGRPPAGMALDRLFRQPAPRVSRRKLLFRAMIDVAVFGNALQTFNWGPYGPNELWPVPWRRVRVVTEDPMSVLWWEAWGAGGSRLLDPNEAVHITWGDDPESVIGVSPIESLQYTIALHNAIDRHLVSYYGNAARPSGILKLNQMPKGDDVERIREQFRQLYTAPEQSGNVIITSAEYQPIAEATGVPTLVELIRLSREEVFGVYGVDPPMVGIYDHAIKEVRTTAEVRMADGTTKMLGLVEPGDRVVTHTGVAATVLGKSAVKVLPVLRITTRRGRVVEVAEDHPVFADGGRIPARDLVPGMRLPIEPAISMTATEIDDDDARLLGYFVGDGSCGPTGTGNRSINAGFTNIDPLLVADWVACCDRKGWRTRQVNHKTLCAAGGVRAWLRHHGVGGKVAATKRVPVAVLHADAWIIGQFLGAYFDSDGCAFSRVGGGHRVYFSTISRGLADDVAHLLARLKIGNRIAAHRQLVKGERYVAWVVDVDVPDVERFAAIVDVRGEKRARLAAIVATPREIPRRPDPADGRPCAIEGCPRPMITRGWCATHYARWRKHGTPNPPTVVGPGEDAVLTVEPVGAYPVQCLALDHVDHSFVADGVVVSNSNIQETRGKYVRDTLGPWATLFEDEWWAQMISQNPLWDYHWSEFDLDERLRPDLLERAQAYANLGDTLTVNEKRRKENVPDLEFPEADTVWMGSGRIPLGYGTPTTTTDLTPDLEAGEADPAELLPGTEDPSEIDDQED